MSHNQEPPGPDKQAQSDFEQERDRLEQERQEREPPAPSALAVETAKKAVSVIDGHVTYVASDGTVSDGMDQLTALIESALAQVRAEERERCANYVDTHPLPGRVAWGIDIAAAIRKGVSNE